MKILQIDIFGSLWHLDLDFYVQNARKGVWHFFCLRKRFDIAVIGGIIKQLNATPYWVYQNH
jgi:hypothetical protein